MKLQRFRWILVIGIAVAAISFTGCKKETAEGGAKPAEGGPKTKAGGGDDEPVVVAGGSTYIGTPSGHRFDPDSTGRLVHSDPNRYVTSVEVIDKDDNPLTPVPTFNNQPVTIDITYCRIGTGHACVSGTSETVTLKTVTLGQGLTISSDRTKMARSPKMIPPNLLTHPRRKKTMRDVSLNGTKVADCYDDGECSITIHYCLTADCK